MRRAAGAFPGAGCAVRVLPGLLLAALLGAGTAVAQPYPARAIRLVAGFPPGGPSDIVSRALARRMNELLGQPVVVENRSGAGGHIAAELVARAAPDGYTVLLGGSFITIGPSLYRKLAYDVLRDFAPIGLVVSNQYLLVVHPSVPAKNVRDLIAIARRQPGRLNYASAGLGSPPHLSAELMKAMAKLEIVHVPYKGATPALVDLISGQVDLYFGGISAAMPHAKAGRLRALGVTGSKRSTELPEVPTIAEAGLPGYEIATWFGLVAPAGTPAPVVERLNETLKRIVGEPDTRAYLISQGVDPITSSPAEFAALIKSEIPKFARIVKAAGIEPE